MCCGGIWLRPTGHGGVPPAPPAQGTPFPPTSPPLHTAWDPLWVPPPHQLHTVLAKETFRVSTQGRGAARPPGTLASASCGPTPWLPGPMPPPGLGCICLLRAHRSRGTKVLWPPSRDPCRASHTPGTHCQLGEIADKPQDPGNGAQDPGLLMHFIRLHQARQDNLQREQGDPTHTFRGVLPSPLSPTSLTSTSEPSRYP